MMPEEFHERRQSDFIQIKLAEHDGHIDTLSSAIEDLASTNGVTNQKLDKLVDTMSAQNVLIEKVNNMDKNLHDSFARRDFRLDALERTHLESGCSSVRLTHESVKSLNKSVDTMREAAKETNQAVHSRIKTAEEKIATYVSGTVVRWTLGIIITIMLVGVSVSSNNNERLLDSIVATNKEVIALDKWAAEKIHTQGEHNKYTDKKFIRLEEGIENCRLRMNAGQVD